MLYCSLHRQIGNCCFITFDKADKVAVLLLELEDGQLNVALLPFAPENWQVKVAFLLVRRLVLKNHTVVLTLLNIWC